MDTVIVGVTSGIAAYKVVGLVKSLTKKYNVIVIMTEKAVKMISPVEFEKASKNKVAIKLFPKNFDYKKVLKAGKVQHISLADKASVICVAPATANVISKIANGIADDLLTTTILASKAKILVCPSMNVNMWNNEATRKNIEILKKRGIFVIEPEEGMLACGYRGKGRLTDISCIEDEIHKLVNLGNELRGKNVIVTAGGTQEEIDAVRVIGNKSSGKMGILIAEECSRRGAKVTLIRGRTSVEIGTVMKDIKVNSGLDMFNAIKNEIIKNDVIIHAAAVSDFTILKQNTKIKSNGPINLKLVPSIKIINEIKKLKKDIFLVGFKAEYKASEKELIKRALISQKTAKCDLVVANNVENVFGSDYNSVLMVRGSGSVIKTGRKLKRIIAQKIVDEIVGDLK